MAADRRPSRLVEGLRDGPRESNSSISAALRKQLQGGSPTGSMRQSVRYTGSPSTRHSRGSVRASVRQPGHSSTLSGLGGADRVQVLDEEGRDRTPRPLLASRPALHPTAGSESIGSWASDSLPDSSGPASERSSVHAQQFGALASLATFGLSDVPSEPLPPDAPAAAGPQAPKAFATELQRDSWAGGGAGRAASRLSVTCRADSRLASRPTAAAAGMRRAKAAQCEPVPVASHGCQSLPWELATSARQAQEAAEEAGVPSLQHGSSPAEAAAEAGAEEEVEAVQAMEAAALGGHDSTRVSMAGRESRLRADSPADLRQSRAGSSLGRPSMAQQDWSRRTSGISMHGAEGSERASMASRATFMGDGGASFLGAPPGGGSRSSVAVPGYRQHAAPALSASEAAAEALRRKKAEEQRALARLPGLEPSLRQLEQALAQNSYHTLVARGKGVQLCRGASIEPTAAAEGDVPGAEQGFAAVAAAEGGGSESATAVTQPRMTAPGGALEDGKGPPVAGAAGAAWGPQELWHWKCEAAQDLPVSCIAWNKARPDLLAVGYGHLEYSASAKGLVAFYSLKNPGAPVWQLATPCGVSALDFSRRNGGTLAVGCFDGSVVVYDIRGRGEQPLARAPPTRPDGSGGHAEPVWSLRYVAAGGGEGEGEELLVSVSTDGRVLAWRHTQSLDPSELMRLKRPPSQRRGGAEQQGSTDGLLGRLVGGTCFDFSPADPRTYLVGTEDGVVHRCSTAFTEQSIQSYSGHAGPVYQVRWCPARPSCFLTCSADWTMRLWSEGAAAPLWTFQLPNAKAEVNDVAWCPANATVFAAAAGNTLQLWDVEHSVLRPRTALTRYGVRVTCLSFCPDAPVLVCGADDGSLTVYSVASVSCSEVAPPEQEARRLEAALQASVYQQLAT